MLLLISIRCISRSLAVLIELINLTKRYGNITAISDINLTIPSGQFFGFLGPNGAGKTTTIKTIVGLLKPTSGTVKVEGFDVQKNPIQAKHVIGFIPDKPFVYEKLTGREFLRFVAGLYEVNGNEIDKRIDQLVHTFCKALPITAVIQSIGSYIDVSL